MFWFPWTLLLWCFTFAAGLSLSRLGGPLSLSGGELRHEPREEREDAPAIGTSKSNETDNFTSKSTSTSTPITSAPNSSLSIKLVTWNFAEKCPSVKDAAFIKKFKGSDLVVLGVQECEDIKPRRHEGHRSKEWRALQKKVLGKTYTCVAQHKMGGLQIAIYGNKRACKLIQGLQILDVACGVGNVLTNKGGICVLLRIKGKTLAFINGHFAAHQTKVAERNADFHRIVSSITARAQPRWLVKALAQKRNKSARRSSSSDIFEQMFQAVGLPDDRAFANRRNRRAISSPPSPLTVLAQKQHKGKTENKKHLANERRLGQTPAIAAKAKKGGGPILPAGKRKVEGRRKGRGKQQRATSRESDDSDGEMSSQEDLGGVGAGLFDLDKIKDRLPALPSFSQSSTQAAPLPLLDALQTASRNVLPTLEDVPFDAIVFLGDFNYRVDLPRMEMEYFKEKTKALTILEPDDPNLPRLRRLLDYDQLVRERSLGRVFRGFSEGDIRFLPTFKYDKGSTRFDSSAKARCPAWTDRILFAMHESAESASTAASSSFKLQLCDYYSIDSRHSDHRPVAAEFTLSL